MAELRTLARPYAKAAFQAASEKQALESWQQQLGLLGAISQQDSVAALLASPSVTADKKVSALLEVAGEEIAKDGGVNNFIAVLAENNRLGLLSTIVELFGELKANLERTVDVTITSAFPVDASAEAALTDSLKAKLSREVKVETNVDKALLGGVLVKAGDIVIDGSVKGRLAKLAEAMNL